MVEQPLHFKSPVCSYHYNRRCRRLAWWILALLFGLAIVSLVGCATPTLTIKDQVARVGYQPGREVVEIGADGSIRCEADHGIIGGLVALAPFILSRFGG